MLTIESLLDLLGSAAVIGLLAVAYGALHRVVPDKRFVAPMLGTLFGLVALIQMHHPLEPYPGLIIDMRSVPIVLAGAFLGVPGLLPCLLIAAVARIDVGGVGMMSGLAAMLIAGVVGLAWQGFSRGQRRGIGLLLVLGLATSLHLLAAVLLPPDLAVWFLREVAPMLAGLNLLCVTLVGALLERERRQIAKVNTLEQAAGFTTGGGLMTGDALAWALEQAGATGTLHEGATTFTIRIRFRGALSRFWGKEADDMAMQAFHQRLIAAMPDGGIVGWAKDDLVVMAIPAVDAAGARKVSTRIRRDVSAVPISLPGMASFRLVLDLEARHYDVLPGLDRIVKDMSPNPLPPLYGALSVALTRPRGSTSAVVPPLDAGRAHANGTVLFGTFDRLHLARYGTS